MDAAENRKMFLPGAPGTTFWNLIDDLHTRQALMDIINDPSIMGATDAVAMSFIATWVRINGITRILQLGTYLGFSTVVLASMVSQNSPDNGLLVTVDPDEQMNKKATGYVAAAGLEWYVKFVRGKSLDQTSLDFAKAHAPYGMIYVDSSHAYAETVKEIKEFTQEGWLKSSGVLFFHDAWPGAAASDPTGEGGVPRALAEALPEAVILQPPFFESGLAFWSPKGN